MRRWEISIKANKSKREERQEKEQYINREESNGERERERKKHMHKPYRYLAISHIQPVPQQRNIHYKGSSLECYLLF